LNIRRHRLTEVFLVRVMKFGWHRSPRSGRRNSAVRPSATTFVERMETHGETIRARCPHGEPIPSADGKMPRRSTMLPLNEATPRQRFWVISPPV